MADLCNSDSVVSNSIVTSFVDSKKLLLGTNKCNKIHIGENRDSCQSLIVNGKEMKAAEQDTYLGDIISKEGTNDKNLAKTILEISKSGKLPLGDMKDCV